jgi:hypothetical protein
VILRALLLLVIAAIGCWPQLAVPDWHGTEGRRVQIALEMSRSGDWLEPTLGGQPTWAKPPLHYWLLAALERLCGHGFAAMRLPSVLGLFAAALLAMELLRRAFGPAAGWVGALGILSSPVVLAEWPTAEIDPLFASLVATSLWCLAFGVARERRTAVLVSGLIGGLALLQKGPPYFVFAAGAYLVWWRRRGLRFALPHFVPLLLVPLCYYATIWLVRVEPGEMLRVANEESIGRIAFFEWAHVARTPEFWLRAVLVQMPFVLWCFWEWRGARDARMDPGDLMLRMCSGASVFAVVILTCFPGRPTRYLLPNVLLFTFAVAPAVAHFAGQRRDLGAFSRRGLRLAGLLGAIGLLVVPFLPFPVGIAGAGLALAFGLLPIVVRTPAHLVGACLLMPLIAAWTVGLERAHSWLDGPRARAPAGALLRREIDALRADDLTTQGHVNAPLLLATGLLPRGDEGARRNPGSAFAMHESPAAPPPNLTAYRDRLRLCLPGLTFVLCERVGAPR